MSVHLHPDVIALGSLSFLLFSVYVEAEREREGKTDNVNSKQLMFSREKSTREKKKKKKQRKKRKKTRKKRSNSIVE